MKRFSLILLAVCTLLVCSSSTTDPTFDKANKTCKGISLDGGVKFVSGNATFRVYVTTSESQADIGVSINKSLNRSDVADWRTVENSPDFTVEFVSRFNDADFVIYFAE